MKVNGTISAYYYYMNLCVTVTKSLDFRVKLSLDFTLFTSSVILGKFLSLLSFFISKMRTIIVLDQLTLFQVQE